MTEAAPCGRDLLCIEDERQHDGIRHEARCIRAVLDAHFAKFAPAIAAINAGFATTVLQLAAAPSKIEGSGGGFRTRQEDTDDPPTVENDGPAAHPREPTCSTRSNLPREPVATCRKRPQ
jgi:hypothetical protein